MKTHFSCAPRLMNGKEFSAHVCSGRRGIQRHVCVHRESCKLLGENLGESVPSSRSPSREFPSNLRSHEIAAAEAPTTLSPFLHSVHFLSLSKIEKSDYTRRVFLIAVLRSEPPSLQAASLPTTAASAASTAASSTSPLPAGHLPPDPATTTSTAAAAIPPSGSSSSTWRLHSSPHRGLLPNVRLLLGADVFRAAAVKDPGGDGLGERFGGRGRDDAAKHARPAHTQETGKHSVKISPCP